MLISEVHKLAIFRMPKVCSFSISGALFHQGFRQHPAANPKLWGEAKLRRRSFVDRMIEAMPGLDDYRKASFTRHPEDRLHSAWRYIHVKCPSIPEGHLDFPEFAALVLENKDLHLGTLWHAGLSQAHLLGDLTQIDFLGKYESIDDDWARFCEWADLDQVPLPHIHTSGPPVDYREAYTPELREQVRDYFADDYHAFQYE